VSLGEWLPTFRGNAFQFQEPRSGRTHTHVHAHTQTVASQKTGIALCVKLAMCPCAVCCVMAPERAAVHAARGDMRTATSASYRYMVGWCRTALWFLQRKDRCHIQATEMRLLRAVA
jgi:hypothetical protein